MSAASWSGDFRRGTNAAAIAPATTSACHDLLRGRAGRGCPRAWYWPQSQIENGDSRPSCQPSVRSQNDARRVRATFGSSRRIENASDRARRAKPSDEAAHAARRATPGTSTQSGATQQRGELRPARERDERRRARTATSRSQKPQIEERGHDRVVRVRARRVLRERVRGPGERQRRREPLAAEAPPDEREPEHAEQVEGERRSQCAAGSSSHFPVQPKSAYPGT